LEKINNPKFSNNFTNNISFTRIGSSIKEARIGRNQSVSELASNLKISEQQLKAIEEGRVDLLPERVFVKAMVKKISENLNLDIKDLMADFYNQNDQNKIQEIVEEVKKDPVTKKTITISFMFNIFLSGVVGFVASSLIFNSFFNYNSKSDTQISFVISDNF